TQFSLHCVIHFSHEHPVLPSFPTRRSSDLACFFSATLQPAFYYRELLGLPENTVYIQVDSPFHAEQLVVKISHDLSTRYRDRSRSEEHTSELQSRENLVCRLLLEKKKTNTK